MSPTQPVSSKQGSTTRPLAPPEPGEAAAAQTPRTPRQQQFIAAAARLFSARGYHSVGINDISGELGLSGPAIYRHYPSKEALLIAVLDDAITLHLKEAREIVAAAGTPEVAIEAIVAHHIEFVFEQAENIVTWRTEFRNLPDADSHRLRYLQRQYTEVWVRTLRALRPELTEDEARACCHATIAVLQSPTEFHSRLRRAELEPLLTRLALHTLGAPVLRVATAATPPQEMSAAG